jgi:hypothetical protein
MRRVNQFSPIEWLKLAPLAQWLRQLRNDLLLASYKKDRPADLEEFLSRTGKLAGGDVALVIAFEQPWALDWLLGTAGKNLPGVTVLVFDNSRTAAARREIQAVCDKHRTPYLALPAYKTRHVNRSHGMAMSWVFHHVVRAIKPRIFGFLDHDLIPVNRVDLRERLREQPIYGMINSGNLGHWSTWAGYCFFQYAALDGKPVNFLYDFSRGLDTGGRNWNSVYRALDRGRLRFAPQVFLKVKLPAVESPQTVEFIDDSWVHIGGISYNENFKHKFEFFSALRKALDEGRSWAQLSRPA